MIGFYFTSEQKLRRLEERYQSLCTEGFNLSLKGNFIKSDRKFAEANHVQEKIIYIKSF